MATPVYVTRVTSNLKGGLDRTLGERTLIVGPNGSGKSAIQNSIELALTGRVSDIAGRADAADLGIVGMMAPAGEPLRATVHLSDGRVASFEAARKDGGWSRGQRTGATGDFPVSRVRQNLTGSPETARKFLLANIGAMASRDEVLRLLPHDLHGVYGKKADTMTTSTEVERLLLVFEQEKSAARRHTQEAEAAEATKARMSSDLPPEPTDDDLRAAEEKADGLRAPPPQNPMRISRAALVTAMEKQTAALMLTHRGTVELNARVEELQAAVTAGDLALRAIHPIVEPLMDVLHHHENFDACMVCGNAWTAASEEMRRGTQEAFGSVKGQLATQGEKETALTEAVHSLAELRADLDRQLVELEALENELANTPEEDSVDNDLEAYRAASVRLEGLRSAKSRWQSVRALRETVWTAQQNAAEAKKLADACGNAIKDLLNIALGKFNTVVQSYLPDTDTFFLMIRDGERDVCRYGLYKNGTYHSALSGAEWARVTLALGCAVGGNGDVVIYTPEERAFDPNTLRSVMQALSESPGQVILTSPVKPSGRIPKGWTVIETNPTTTPTETE